MQIIHEAPTARASANIKHVLIRPYGAQVTLDSAILRGTESVPVVTTIWARDLATVFNSSDLHEASMLDDREEVAHWLTKNGKAVAEALSGQEISYSLDWESREYRSPREHEDGSIETHYEALAAKVITAHLPQIFDFEEWSAPKADPLQAIKAELEAERNALKAEFLRLSQDKELAELKAEIAKLKELAKPAKKKAPAKKAPAKKRATNGKAKK